ncbi:MAG: hypothetical protein QOF82_1098, partial [Frankiales bacterium]|nr:hypothetical protein [Frankiales bacterium]
MVRLAWVCSARGRSGSRAAARAMFNASIGSLLPRVRADWRVNAISFGGTRTTVRPAPNRARSNRVDTCRQSSTA